MTTHWSTKILVQKGTITAATPASWLSELDAAGQYRNLVSLSCLVSVPDKRRVSEGFLTQQVTYKC